MAKNYWSFKTFRDGLETVWKEYQVIVMRYLWALEEGEQGAGSGKVWEATNLVLMRKGKSISRASCIFFLNAMVDEASSHTLRGRARAVTTEYILQHSMRQASRSS